MDLAQNLKKTLTNLVEKILVELSCRYIKQKARQIMKKQDNSLSIKFLQNPLTMDHRHFIIQTYCQDIFESIIMETTTEDIVAHVREWSLNRIADKSIVRGDAKAILAEFYEWIDSEDVELEVISLHT